ncbi:MAG: curlin repeat-containing protein, partial [Plesiomonas sp.]
GHHNDVTVTQSAYNDLASVTQYGGHNSATVNQN